MKGKNMTLRISDSTAKIPQIPNFKGKYKQTANGNTYYSTNSAAVAGGILAVPAFIVQARSKFLSAQSIKSNLELVKNFLNKLDAKDKNIFDKVLNSDKYAEIIEKTSRSAKSKKWVIASMASALTLGSGLIVNCIRNKNAKKAVDEINQKGAEQAYNDNDKLNISENGHLYYKSNDGKKWGALLGSGTAAIFIGTNYLFNRSIVKETQKWSKSTIKNILTKVGTSKEMLNQIEKGLKSYASGLVAGVAAFLLGGFALGGFIMGAIADSAANKKARRNA